MNILIIEDDPFIALDIKSMVDALNGHFSVIASDTQSALKAAEDDHFDIILADINLKNGDDGIFTAKTLQNLYNSMVIFITSQKDDDTLKRTLDVDFFSFILKPFSEDDLITAIKLCSIKSKEDTSIYHLGNGYTYDQV